MVGSLVDQADPARSRSPGSWVRRPRWLPRRQPSVRDLNGDGVVELTTVADDEAVVFVDGTPRRLRRPRARHDGRPRRARGHHPAPRRASVWPGSHRQRRALRREGVRRRRGRPTSVRPSRPSPRAEPYPEVMNRGAVAEMAAVDPDAVMVKGDLTADGTRRSTSSSSRCTARRSAIASTCAATTTSTTARTSPTRPTQEVDAARRAWPSLDTVRVATINGSLVRRPAGVARRARRPRRPAGAGVRPPPHVEPGRGATRSDDYFGLRPDAAEALTEVFARRPRLVGYFAGHTHRNRVRAPARRRCAPVRRGGVREGLPRLVGRVPGVRGRRSCRCTAASRPPTRSRGPSAPAACSAAPTPPTPAAIWPTAASRWAGRSRVAHLGRGHT